MFKKCITATILTVMLLLSTPISAKAGSVTWTTSYGTATGTSSTYTWSQSNSPTYRRITATTRNSQAAPKIAAEVYGYYQGDLVMSATNTASNQASVSANDNNSAYGNKSITGNGCHAVWSSTLARKNHYSSF